VFWQDYYNWGLRDAGYRSGIAALVGIHEDHAGGTTSDLHCDDNLYVTQRSGASVQKGLVFVMNNRGDAWNGTWVKTQWNNTKFVPAAWCGRNDTGVPGEQWTQGGRMGRIFCSSERVRGLCAARITAYRFAMIIER
jgi:alpha-amylase